MAEPAKVLNFRALATVLMNRSRFGSWLHGLTFAGARDFYRAFGYDRDLTVAKMRARYIRGGIAGRVVEAMPEATWRAGGELIEDEDPDTYTAFEEAWDELNHRLNCWQAFQRADILCGFGHYAVILLGGPGELMTELTSMKPQDLKYLQVFAEDDAQIQSYENDPENERYGQPTMYGLTRSLTGNVTSFSSHGRPAHWTRCIHVADGLLEDDVNGQARLERVWNLLDDLEKVTGGGSEAFFKRADAGMQLDMSPEVDAPEKDSPEEKAMDEEIDNYTHDFQRILRTRGVTIKNLGSQVADFKGPADALIAQICASCKIPQRIFLGSERGNLASEQDRDNFSDRVQDRQNSFAGPRCVKPFVDRLVKFKTLPKPKQYDARWPEIKNLNDVGRADVATKWAALGRDVVEANEIRDRILGLPPLDNPQVSPEAVAAQQALLAQQQQRQQPGQPVDEKLVAAAARAVVQRKVRLRKFMCLSANQRAAYLRRGDQTIKALQAAVQEGRNSLESRSLRTALERQDKHEVERLLNAATHEIEHVLARRLPA